MSTGLAHLQVVEVGQGVAAAMAGKMLADLGATVVKVEPPGGDPLRRRGPFPRGAPHPETSGTFLFLNANKRSLVLDLTSASGQAELAELAAQAHLLLHDLPPQRMADCGLDYEALAGRNPRLVLLSLTPFGLSGPYRDYVADDLTLFHAGGWGYVCPGKGAPPELPPNKPFGQHALIHAGLHGAVAALGAVYGAAAGGVGEHIDLSIQEVVAVLLGRPLADYTYAGQINRRFEPLRYEPSNFFPCRDGTLFIICVEQTQWDKLVQLMGSPAWATDGRMDQREGRGEHQQEIRERLGAWTSQWALADLFRACQEARVGAAPVYTFPELAAEAHLAARGALVTQRHPVAGEVRLPGAPYKLHPDCWALRRPAPTLNEAGAERAPLFAHHAPAPPPTPAAPPAPPLAGVRVLDLTWVWAGPHCTLLLAMLGAEVIKVETSARQDLTRRTPPFPTGRAPGTNNSGYFHLFNQGKQSIGLDLTRPEGLALVKRLATRSDVMVSNFGFGVVERLGLGAEEMRRLNPDLIVAAISAFGRTGPYRKYLGYGPLIAPASGLSAQTGYPSFHPTDVGTPYGDPNGGVYTALAICAALVARQNGAGGRVIDVSMWEAMLHSCFEGWMNHALGNPPHAPMGNRDPVHAPHNLYRCAGDDAWVAISACDDARWQALCGAMGRADLAADPRFAAEPARKTHEDALDAEIGAWCAGQEPWAVTRVLQAAGVAAFPSLNTKELVEDPHLAARGFITRYPHPEVGPLPLSFAPWQLARHPVQGGPAPLLGEHGDRVLNGLLGLSAAEIARLRADGIVE